jgi:hypothetical protein
MRLLVILSIILGLVGVDLLPVVLEIDMPLQPLQVPLLGEGHIVDPKIVFVTGCSNHELVPLDVEGELEAGGLEYFFVIEDDLPIEDDLFLA